jgi:cytochrome c oxidase accessory protein FixG
VAYLTIAILTATTFAFGGFFREQICIYACPWPRIQAAMMDEDTLTVSYRPWRGEPRGKLQKDQGAGVEKTGDCIDCMACVNVCPMGIDIRNGQQLACITCALCIDACDDVMVKVGKPTGLIGYLALKDEEAERAGHPAKSPWRHIFRVRTMVYTVLWAGVGAGLVVALFLRSPIDASVSPVRNPLFVTLADGTIRNIYEVRLRNKSGEVHPFRISIATDANLRIALEGTTDLTIPVAADQTFTQRVYVQAEAGSPEAAARQIPIRFWIEDTGNTDRTYANSVFHGTGE